MPKYKRKLSKNYCLALDTKFRDLLLGRALARVRVRAGLAPHVVLLWKAAYFSARRAIGAGLIVEYAF